MTDPRIEAAETAITESLRETVYTCGRVWEAWQVGTMSEDDFAPAWEDDELINDIATEALKAADNASTITTVEELEKLPVGSVILDPIGLALQLRYDGCWWCTNGATSITAEDIVREGLPARALHWGNNA